MENLIIIVAIIIGGFIVFAFVRSSLGGLKDNEKEQALASSQNAQQICPHCQTRGKVRTEQEWTKKGVSGGKLVAAIFTGGISILFVGLSRKELQTKANCTNCGSTWHFS